MTREEAAKVLDCAWRGLDWKTTMNINEAYGLAIKRLREPSGWVRTADRLPTEADANDEGKVTALITGALTGKLLSLSLYYKSVTADSADYFLPLPKLPEVEE